MWVADDEGCSPMRKGWFNDALFVFAGEATCCRLGHKHGMASRCDRESLVLPVLGLYGELYASSRAGSGSRTGSSTHESGSGSVATLRASFEASTPADAANGRKSVEVGMDAEARRRTKFKMAFTQLREDVTASVDVDNLEVEEDLESPASLGSASTISPGIRSLISPSSNQASANKARSLASPPDDANVASCAVHECCQQGRLACN